MSRRNEGRTLRRILVALAILVLLSPLLFLGLYRFAAKKALSGPLLRNEINGKPEELKIDWDEAVSAWPGRVTVKNLTIRGSDPNVQWIVTVPEATLRYSLVALLRRTFLVRALRPTSIQFRIRQRVPKEQATPARLKGIPEIPGFPDPPLRDPDAKRPPPEPNPFTIRLLDVTTDAFDDIWFDAFRYRGKGSLTGSFRLKPGHFAQIGPARVVFSGGVVTVADEPTLTETRGKLEATFADWDVEKLTENKVFQVVTAKAEIESPLASVDFLESALDLGKGVDVSAGAGQFALSGTIDQGKASGTVDLTVTKGRYARPGLVLEGGAEAHVKFGSWELDGGAPQVGGTSVKLTDVYAAGGASGTSGWWGVFDIPSGRMSNGLTAKVALECKDGRPLLAFLGELPRWTRGLIDLDGLTATADVVFSEPRTTVRGLHATGGKFVIDGEYDRRVDASRGAFLIETGVLTLGVELDNQKTNIRPILARQWFAKSRT